MAGGSQSTSSNSSNSTGQFSQNVFRKQVPYLQDLWGTSGNVGNQVLGRLNQSMPGVVDTQNQITTGGMGGWQNLMNGGAFAGVNGSDIAGTIQQQLAGINGNQMQGPGALGPASSIADRFKLADTTNPFGSGPTATQSIYSSIMGGNGNNYADAMRGQMQQDARSNLDSSLNAIDARAAMAGMGGSSRQGIAQANAAKDVNDALMREQTNLGYNTFDKDLQNKLQIAQQADSNRLGAYQAGLNYNTGIAGALNAENNQNQGYNLGMNQTAQQGRGTGYNFANSLIGQLTGMAGGANESMLNGANMTGAMQNVAGAPLQTLQAPWQSMDSWANTLGGPIVLGKGSMQSSSSGKSKAGGGGIL